MRQHYDLSFEQLVEYPEESLNSSENGSDYRIEFNGEFFVLTSSENLQVDERINLQEGKKQKALERVLERAFELASSGKNVLLTAERKETRSPEAMLMKANIS